MPTELSERMAALTAGLQPRAEALGLALDAPPLSPELELGPAAARAAAEGLAALGQAVLARAVAGGRLRLALGVALSAGERRLRLLAADSLPGLAATAQPAAFAFLLGDAPPPASDPLGLAGLLASHPPGSLDFFSHGAGSLVWLDLPLGESHPPTPGLPGWARRPCLDSQDLLRRLGGDQRIARLVVDSFREDAPRQLAALRAALAAPGERQEAIRLAHSLKGASRNTGGLMLGEVAAAVETALQHERLDEARASLLRLDWELGRLEAAWGAQSA